MQSQNSPRVCNIPCQGILAGETVAAQMARVIALLQVDLISKNKYCVSEDRFFGGHGGGTGIIISRDRGNSNRRRQGHGANNAFDLRSVRGVPDPFFSRTLGCNRRTRTCEDDSCWGDEFACAS